MSDVSEVDGWYRSGAWLADWGAGVRVIEIRLKITPTGGLAIVKGISAEGPVVTFYGGPGPGKVLRDLQSALVREGLKWRGDKYALDNLEKNS